jgi:hypothetical protein
VISSFPIRITPLQPKILVLNYLVLQLVAESCGSSESMHCCADCSEQQAHY